MFRRVRSFLLVTSCISPVSLVLFSLVMTGVAFYGIRELRMDSITVQQLVTYFFLRAGPDLVGQSGRVPGWAAAPGEFDVRKHQAAAGFANGPDTAAGAINPVRE